MSSPTFTDILRSEVARMQALKPERIDEITRAHAAIIEGHVVPVDTDNGQVLSRNGHTWYSVNGRCSCEAASFGKPCRHLSAWKLYKHVEKQWQSQQPEAPAAPTSPASGIPAHFIQDIQGQRFVKYAGLLQLAHDAGLQSLTADWTYNDGELSLAKAVALFADGRRFEESGDSTPQNAARVKLHWRRLSLTRAKARALRDALAIDLCSVEEMD